jgi:hypothetical protein
MATEVPREKLKELIEKNGESLLQDRDRCEGLLKDYCGGHRREISALVGALEERVPLELKGSWQTAMTPEAMRARLVQRLEDNRGLAPEIANYAVDTWSYALGVGLGRSSDRVQDLPIANSNGIVPVVASAAERAAADRPAGSQPAFAPVVVPAPIVAPPAAVVPAGALSKQNKAMVGGVGLLAIAAVAFGLLHHPQQSTSTNTNPPPPIPAPQPAQNTNPATNPAQKPAPSDTVAKNKVSPPASGTSSGTAAAPASGPASVVVRLDSDFNSDHSTVGELLPATVVSPVTSGGDVIVPRGATAQLRVVRIDKSGKVSGRSEVEFALVGLTAHGKLMHISGASKSVDGPSQGARTAERTGIGGAAGAAIGAITGHLFHHAGAGALAGAGAGGATGALTSHAAPVKISAETVLQFRLTKGIPTGT